MTSFKAVSLRPMVGVAAVAAAALLAACTTTATPPPSLAETPAAHTVFVSADSFAVVESRLRQGIADRPLTLFTVVDHGEGARQVGTPIGQSKLFVVGNPEVGTPFMVADPQMGLDLPLRVLVHESGGTTHLAYSHPGEAAARHGVADQVQPQIDGIHTAMRGLLSEAAGNTLSVVNAP